MSGDSSGSATGGKAATVVAIMTAVVLLAIFLFVTYQLMNAFVLSSAVESDAQAIANGRRWDRALVLFNPIVSLAFAAAGALLGAQVQQVRVNDLKQDVKAKDQKIKDAREALSPSDVGGGSPAPESLIAEARRVLNR